jgi:hypothetical protein
VLNNPLVLIDPDGRQVDANRFVQQLFRQDPTLARIDGAVRGTFDFAARPGVRDLAAGLTPGVGMAQDATMVVTGRDFANGERVGAGGRVTALAGLLIPGLTGSQMRAVGEFGDFVIGTAGRAARVGAKTPGGFKLTRDAAVRLSGRLEGKLGLDQLDDIIASPTVRRFEDATKPGTVRIFDPSMTQFGGDGLNVVINPETRKVITVFPSSSTFMRNERFSEVVRDR